MIIQATRGRSTPALPPPTLPQVCYLILNVHLYFYFVVVTHSTLPFSHPLWYFPKNVTDTVSTGVTKANLYAYETVLEA